LCVETTQTCAVSCTDDLRNGDETDVDCGGSCLSCEGGGSCLQNSDCASGACSSAEQRCLTVVGGRMVVVGVTLEEWNQDKDSIENAARNSIANAAGVHFNQVAIVKVESKRAPQRRRVLQEKDVTVEYEVVVQNEEVAEVEMKLTAELESEAEMFPELLQFLRENVNQDARIVPYNPNPTGAPTPAPTQASDDSDLVILIGISCGVVVVVGALVAALVRYRRRQSKYPHKLEMDNPPPPAPWVTVGNDF